MQIPDPVAQQLLETYLYLQTAIYLTDHLITVLNTLASSPRMHLVTTALHCLLYLPLLLESTIGGFYNFLQIIPQPMWTTHPHRRILFGTGVDSLVSLRLWEPPLQCIISLPLRTLLPKTSFLQLLYFYKDFFILVTTIPSVTSDNQRSIHEYTHNINNTKRIIR